MFTQVQFKADSPEEKIAEVYAFCEKLGLSPDRALIRIFNAGLMDSVKASATDRAGIDEVDTRSYNADNGFGYTELLKNKGLKTEDGIYATPLKDWAPVFTAGLFEHETLSIPSFRTAIAVYDGDKMLDIFDDRPSSARAASGEPTGEFYYFKDPSKKHDALAGVMLQPPTQIDRFFCNLSMEKKIDFVEGLLQKLDENNQDMIYQLIKDMYRDTQRKLHDATKTGNAASQKHLKELQGQIKRLDDDCYQRRSEVAFFDEFNQQLDMLKDAKAAGKKTRGTSVEFIAENVQEQLEQNIRPDYREKLLVLFSELQKLDSSLKLPNHIQTTEPDTLSSHHTGRLARKILQASSFSTNDYRTI